MNNIADQVIKVIDAIAQKLGVAAELVYPILRRQAMVDGIMYLCVILLCVVCTMLMFRFSKRADFEGFNRYTAYCLISGIISFACFMTSTMSFRSMLTALLNPDWYIINNVLKQLVTITQ